MPMHRNQREESLKSFCDILSRHRLSLILCKGKMYGTKSFVFQNIKNTFIVWNKPLYIVQGKSRSRLEFKIGPTTIKFEQLSVSKCLKIYLKLQERLLLLLFEYVTINLILNCYSK